MFYYQQEIHKRGYYYVDRNTTRIKQVSARAFVHEEKFCVGKNVALVEVLDKHK